MVHRDTIPFHDGVARVVRLSELQQVEAWQHIFAGVAKDHRFYEIAEQTLANVFEHYYLVLEDRSGRVRAIQPVFFVQQNVVEGVPGARRAVDLVRRRRPRFLTMRILMIGCAAGTGALGVVKERDAEWLTIALLAVLQRLAAAGDASLIVFKDFSAQYRETFERFTDNGFTRVPGMPMTRLALSGHHAFDQYVTTLGRSTRKDLRRKFRKIEKAAPIVTEVTTDVAAIVDELYPLYLQVRERSPMKFEQLTKDYFRSLGERMPDRVRFFIWRQEGRIIAFSVALVHDGTIYDDYLGLDYRVAFDLHLYFYTFRDIIRWSLAQGLQWYCSSPLNYQPKLHLGCELMPLDLYVMHTSPLLNRLSRPALKFLEPTRHDPVLRKFQNVHEL